MAINHQGEQAQRLNPLLAHRLTESITLYKQHVHQADVWQTLNGKKDDFFIYDRCGRLTHHMSLPYTFIGHGHVESAIKKTYCNRICGECSHEVKVLCQIEVINSSLCVQQSNETAAECTTMDAAQPEAGDHTEHAQNHHHGRHAHHGHHGHGHHGDNHDSGHGHDQNHDHRHGNHHGCRLAMQVASISRACDTVTRRCPPLDSDTA
uniref:Selenoprotein P N-terminal domain-containing protein n=1 Tax=Nothobranchius furzeri TaxID=105023 RepID=A0A8C6LLH2_NOTFU